MPFRRTGFGLGFKLWFAFCALAGLGVLCLMIYAGIEVAQVADDPEAIGAYFGEIVKGFEEASQ